jgi:hypothetical protein
MPQAESRAGVRRSHGSCCTVRRWETATVGVIEDVGAVRHGGSPYAPPPMVSPTVEADPVGRTTGRGSNDDGSH